MFDFWRNLWKSEAEKEQELIHAYVDNALTPAERADFAARLAREPALRAEVESLQQVKQRLAALPRQPVPRSFTLDPAKYGRPARQPLVQAQPILRVATAVTAVFFVIILALEWGPGAGDMAQFSAQETQMAEGAAIVEDAAIMESADQVVTDQAEEYMADAEPPAEPMAPSEETVDGEMVAAEATIEEEDEMATLSARIATDDDAATTATTTTITSTEIAETAVFPADPITPSSRAWLPVSLGAVLILLITLLALARRQAMV